MLHLYFPEIIQAPTEEGIYMGVAVQAGEPRHMYLWQGQTPPELPRDPCYLEPVGSRETFWARDPIVWDRTYPAVAGVTRLRGECVPVFDYLRFQDLLRSYVNGVSNAGAETEVFSLSRRLRSEDHGKKTPVFLFTPSVRAEDMHPRRQIKPEGSLVPPPSL